MKIHKQLLWWYVAGQVLNVLDLAPIQCHLRTFGEAGEREEEGGEEKQHWSE